MRYLINFSYDGSTFNGYQRQNKLRTVQKQLEDVLKVIAKENVLIHATGRTDAKVHAINQYAHFDMDLLISEDKLKYVLNNMIDPYIYIKKVKIVSPSFHARYNVLEKEYKYIINISEYDPLKVNYEYQYCDKLDIKKMEKALKLLFGEHDFRPFVTTQKDRENCVRVLKKVSIKEEDNKVIITMVGDGFLRRMVRNIVGVLVDIGANKKEISYITDILDNKVKRISKTVPGEGLYLNKVTFKK